MRGNAVVLDSVGARPDTSELLYPAYSATPDIVITKTELFCRVWCGDVKWVGPTARQVLSVSSLRRSASGGRSGRASSICATAADATQASQAARPPTRSDVIRHAKCKHAVGVMTAAYD